MNRLRKSNSTVSTRTRSSLRSSIESSHPPKENILINVGKDLLKASPFKLPPTKLREKDEERKIIEQNNYTNKCLNVIGDQLEKLENKIDSINIKQTPNTIETPLIKTQELKTGLSLKLVKQKLGKRLTKC
jgi:hypothetical protein